VRDDAVNAAPRRLPAVLAEPLHRRQLLGLLAGGIASAAAGCTRPERTPASSQEAPPSFTGEGPIVFAGPMDISLGEQRRQAVQRWNQDHPGQEAVAVDLPSAADHQRAHLIARLQAGRDDYDVLGLDVVWTAEFARGGYILPLDSVSDQLGIDRFLDAAHKTVQFEGKLWGVPLFSNAGLLYYRTDLVDGPPNSWAELADQAAAARRPGIAGYVGQLARYEGLTVNLAEAIWGLGGSLLKADGLTLDTDATRSGLAFLAGGLRDGWIPRAALTYDEELSRLAFQDGKAVFMRNWPYAYDLLDAQDSPVKGKFNVVRLPGVSALGGANLAISRFSKRGRTALDFIRFLTDDKVQTTTFEEGGYPAAVSSVYEDRAVQAGQPYTEALKEAIRTAESRPDTPFYGQVTRVVQEAAWPALQRGEEPDRAAERLSRSLEAALRGR
jgi:multiple sugar transport system substrate-binding protein